MKHLRTYEGFSNKKEIEIFPDDNSESTFKVSIDEYEELKDLGYLNDYNNTYDSDKYYDIMQMLGNISED
jgi:hypothetical protein